MTRPAPGWITLRATSAQCVEHAITTHRQMQLMAPRRGSWRQGTRTEPRRAQRRGSRGGHCWLWAWIDPTKDSGRPHARTIESSRSPRLCASALWAIWPTRPVLIPPFDFADIEGVIPLTQGFRINDALKLNLFKDEIETIFGLESSHRTSAWERKRDRVIARLNVKIASAAEH